MKGNSYVYFIQQGNDGPIKIGISINPAQRYFEMQGHNPYELHILGVIEGEMDLESELHQRFDAFHLRGEWFRPMPELINFIRSHALPMSVSRKSTKGRIQPSEKRYIITNPFHSWNNEDWKCFLATKDVTVDEVAAELGYSTSYVTNLLNGSDEINDRARFRLMRAFPDCTDMLLASGNNKGAPP